MKNEYSRKNPEPVISPTEPFEGNALITSYSNIAYSKSPVTGEMTYKMWLLIRNSLGGFPHIMNLLTGSAGQNRIWNHSNITEI